MPKPGGQRSRTVCEYFAQGDGCLDIYCDKCGSSLEEYDTGYGTVFYSVGPESVRWSIGDGSIICPDCIGNEKYKAVQPI